MGKDVIKSTGSTKGERGLYSQVIIILIFEKITINKHFRPIFVKYVDENGQQKEEFYICGLDGKQLLSQSEAYQYTKSLGIRSHKLSV